ncbi:MAG: adenylyltransferase/cytidyltransferase family protein [Patescibacteria group bacterium]
MAKPGKKVMVFGTFALMHPGHLYFFKKAKEHGGYLIVVIARDETVKKVKGFFPKLGELARREMVGAIKFVDEAVLGDKFDWYKIILKYKPDIICLGYDQEIPKNFSEELWRRGVVAKIIRLKSYKPEKYKSSLIA